MGEAVAGLLQDDAIALTAYKAREATAITTEINNCLDSLHILPRTTCPTEEGLRKRAVQRLSELSAETQLTQARRWRLRQRNPFEHGISIGAMLAAVQKFALPLLCGIVLALILANFEEEGYNKWAGASHVVDGPDDDVDAIHPEPQPTFFGLSLHDHPLTLQFLVNDILMSLFFWPGSEGDLRGRTARGHALPSYPYYDQHPCRNHRGRRRTCRSVSHTVCPL